MRYKGKITRGKVDQQVMNQQEQQPDWDRLAEKFDYWLPHFAPVSETLITALRAQPGDSILDIACGTGEPSLSLAQTMQGKITITATDAAQGMVSAAQRKAERANLHCIHFENMQAESLAFANNAFDAVISRFGVMLFNNPLQGLKEIHRVLKPGGRFALAVWGSAETMTTLNWAYEAFDGHIPEEAMPPLALATRFGTIDAFEEILNSSGFTRNKIETHELNYRFASFEDYWQTIEASDIMKLQLDALAHPAAKLDIKQALAKLAAQHEHGEGLTIPHQYLVASDIKE